MTDSVQYMNLPLIKYRHHGAPNIIKKRNFTRNSNNHTTPATKPHEVKEKDEQGN